MLVHINLFGKVQCVCIYIYSKYQDIFCCVEKKLTTLVTHWARNKQSHLHFKTVTKCTSNTLTAWGLGWSFMSVTINVNPCAWQGCLAAPNTFNGGLICTLNSLINYFLPDCVWMFYIWLCSLNSPETGVQGHGGLQFSFSCISSELIGLNKYTVD